MNVLNMNLIIIIEYDENDFERRPSNCFTTKVII